ncbi:hypothetical protein Pla144_32960 [Bythopirellula polymerisocia]|uniref:Uncharacterized protein n=1 Tax=Bythopirellula polymerisocia TaxID=2528003 RepID=A0A5C6CTL5_9BACT|nr:hypothetical protein Pla144_32960 [Bythopirellula polymerisocia]
MYQSTPPWAFQGGVLYIEFSSPNLKLLSYHFTGN